ncbi:MULTISPECIES: TetR/AcrR family transcriptional regulator [Polyangium]|uniref:TetR/AcrR family transcriptional regulator n=2 Tax=Polyangium TaxID=55 RepID=A0A4U1IV80_9BACT|nr:MULTISPECIES: TetR/AcrR family transcriptional regulator [Polyangium]MDI1434429.1 TetR family transcriptional regulator [Polyangium sorediatum]TKC98259.1 TetR/AcrR family transcriptional regulator [Polyangium fumosum]
MPRTEPKKPTRQRDADRTRTAILDAARTLFSTRGFTNTGVREVAELAGVNSALVGRYFGSKEGLYRATLERIIDISPMLHGDRRRFGVDMVAIFCDTQDASGPLAMMILSAADPAAHAASIEFLQTKVMVPLAAWLGPPNAEERAARLNILWTGFLTSWKLLPLEPLSDARIASTRRWLEAATQAIVDEGTG